MISYNQAENPVVVDPDPTLEIKLDPAPKPIAKENWIRTRPKKISLPFFFLQYKSQYNLVVLPDPDPAVFESRIRIRKHDCNCNSLKIRSISNCIYFIGNITNTDNEWHSYHIHPTENMVGEIHNFSEWQIPACRVLEIDTVSTLLLLLF